MDHGDTLLPMEEDVKGKKQGSVPEKSPGPSLKNLETLPNKILSSWTGPDIT